MVENNIFYKYSIHTLELHSHLAEHDYDTFYSALDNLNACSPEISKKEIPDIISKMAGKGTFHTYSYVMGQIDHSGFRQNAKHDMMSIVDYLSRHKSCKNMHDKLELTRQDWNEYLKKFDQLGCSPVPIPRTYKFCRYPGVSDWDTMETFTK